MIPKPSTLTINHDTMGRHRKRVEGRDGGNAETPRHNREKAGVMLVELALVDISYGSGLISEFGAVRQVMPSL